MNILFVDDDDIRTKPLKEHLTNFEKYNVLFVKTPDEALKSFKENPIHFQAVLVDIMLPHNDIPEYKEFAIPKYFSSNSDGMYTGLKLIIQLFDIMRNVNTKIPLIVLTCIEDIEIYLIELNLKVDRILIKPIFLADFIKEVKNVIQA